MLRSSSILSYCIERDIGITNLLSDWFKQWVCCILILLVLSDYYTEQHCPLVSPGNCSALAFLLSQKNMLCNPSTHHGVVIEMGSPVVMWSPASQSTAYANKHWCCMCQPVKSSSCSTISARNNLYINTWWFIHQWNMQSCVHSNEPAWLLWISHFACAYANNYTLFGMLPLGLGSV